MIKGRVAIPLTALPKLRDLFLVEWPKHIVPYSLLQNYINWSSKDLKYVEENVEIYCLDSDWNDGTFYLVVRFVYIYDEFLKFN